MKTTAQPFVKWLGGKRQLLAQLLPILGKAECATYYEPFVGGGAVFFALARQKAFTHAVLNDLNPDLHAAYSAIQGNVSALVSTLKTFPVEREFFDDLRLRTPSSTLERAARLMYLTRTSFNGLYRVNSKGQFNAPWGSYLNPRICDEPNLNLVHEALKGVTLKCEDFEQAVGNAQRGDLVYFDPPYVPLNPTSSFTAYTSNGFGVQEHLRLYKTFLELTHKGVNVVLSNSDTPFVRSLYQDWTLNKVLARRNVNSKGTLRGPVGELIVTNFQEVCTPTPMTMQRGVELLHSVYSRLPWFQAIGQTPEGIILYVKKKLRVLQGLEASWGLGFPVKVGKLGVEVV